MRTARRALVKKENIDPLDVIRKALTGLARGEWMEKFMTAERGILYYALFSWHAKPHVSSATRAFASFHYLPTDWTGGYIRSAPFGCVLELLPAHLLLKHRGSWLALTATGVSLYGAIWLIGMARAIQLRPVLVGPDYLLASSEKSVGSRVPANDDRKLGSRSFSFLLIIASCLFEPVCPLR